MRLTGSNLTAVRGGRTVFSGLSLALADGEVLAVRGANGSGKSTLLRLIAGLLRPASGSFALDPLGDGDIAGALHYVGHLDSLKTALTVRENLDFWRKLWRGGSVEAALERLGLDALADLPVSVLSAGQKRRAAIARLLLSERSLWLLDEPATSLDAEAEATLGRLIAAHVESGGMAIVVTHRELPIRATANLALGIA